MLLYVRRSKIWTALHDLNGHSPHFWIPMNPLIHPAASGSKASNHRTTMIESLAMRQHVKYEMTAGREIVGDAAKGLPQIAYVQQVIDGIEVGGDQIHGIRKPKTPNVLLKEHNVPAPTIRCCLSEHPARAINGKNRNLPDSIQVVSKQTCAASDVGG